MNYKQRTGDRNLKLLCWLGLTCQAIGVFLFLAFALKLQFGSAWGGPLFLTFGIAVGGWAGNLLEITGLKRRITELESRVSTTK